MAAQILAQATRLFAARGFVGASLQDIAKAVGIRKPSLLYHFPSKDKLRRSVLEQMLEHWNEVVPRLLRAATSGREQFDALGEETIKFFSEDPDRARVLLRELLDRPEEMGPLIRDRVQPWTDVVSGYIRKGQAQGRVHADVDPEAYVSAVINLILSSIAVHAVAGSLLGGDTASSSIHPRLLDEVLRVARSALFIPEPAQAVLPRSS
ncbi:MAG: TetR/AcrR family transcriptional regulator [Nannocystaceae bacterium]|nr:TetR/AcrR family transcriptional regulator [Nannocystaceae bacterium]